MMTLDICGRETIHSPTPEDIRRAVNGLDASGDAFLILGPEGVTYIQCSGDAKCGFDLEYQEGSINNHFRSDRDDWDAETVITKFTQYAAGDPAWKEGVEWEKLTW